jgi:hypothetical protein
MLQKGAFWLWIVVQKTQLQPKSTNAPLTPALPRPTLVMSMNVREIQKFKHSFLRKLGSDMSGRKIVLRPHNHAHSVEMLTMEAEESLSDYLIGRICYRGMET